jgi:GntR family transcriptional regulator, transcriptional repressor for pyruvate dehydrogenase complex
MAEEQGGQTKSVRSGDGSVERADVTGLTLPRDELKSDRVASELERRILGGELEPGARLPTESELGAILGVSRSVVRDAIRALVARGLVSVRQGQGMTVAAPSDAAFGRALIALLTRSDLTMGDVIDARATIETRLVPLAARAGTRQDWEHLDEVCSAFEQAVEAGDWDAVRPTHLEFHLAVMRALHQPALELFLKPMTEIILVSSTPPRPATREDWEVETHRPILEALAAGKSKRAEEAVSAHFAAMTDPDRYRAFRARPFGAVFTELPWARP